MTWPGCWQRCSPQAGRTSAPCTCRPWRTSWRSTTTASPPAAPTSGNSAYTGYTPNERSILSLALVDPAVEIGDEIVIHWGEAGGGYGDALFLLAMHIAEIRATVSPAPYTRVAREDYRKRAISGAA